MNGPARQGMFELEREVVVVTGGAGFLGRELVQRLRECGVSEERVRVPRRAEFDLTREGDVARMFAEMRPSVVVHLAAEVGGIGANAANPGRFFYANLAMGLHLIEHARRSGVKKFVQVGTVCSYPKFTAVPFREDELWNGYPEETNAPYGIAKKALLTMLQAYRAQYGLNGIYLLPVNLYGPGDNFDPTSSHVIPALIRKMVEAKAGGEDRVTIWGTGSASREFLHVRDCARGVSAALIGYDGAEPINLGSGVEITIRKLAEKVASIVGFTGRLEWDSSRPDGQPRRRLDTSRAATALGFRAETGLEEGLRETVDWYVNQRRE